MTTHSDQTPMADAKLKEISDAAHLMVNGHLIKKLAAEVERLRADLAGAVADRDRADRQIRVHLDVARAAERDRDGARDVASDAIDELDRANEVARGWEATAAQHYLRLVEYRDERDALAAKLDAVRTIVPELRRIVGDGTRSEIELIDAVEVLVSQALDPAPESPRPPELSDRGREVVGDQCPRCGGQMTAWESRVGGVVVQTGIACGGTCGWIGPEWTHPDMPAAPAQSSAERLSGPDGGTETGTPVSGPHDSAQASKDHWLKWDTIARTITGCQCGFKADMDSDCGFGDSVVAHLIEVGSIVAAEPVPEGAMFPPVPSEEDTDE